MSMAFCPGCGAPLLLETQRFCATFGYDLQSLRERARGAQVGPDRNEPVTEATDGAAALPDRGLNRSRTGPRVRAGEDAGWASRLNSPTGARSRARVHTSASYIGEVNEDEWA